MTGSISKRAHRLTSKQARLLRFIHEFRQEYGDGPTMTMMVKELGLASNRSVIDMLKLLVSNGYLKPNTPNTKISRSTILTSKAYRAIYIVPQPQFHRSRPYYEPVQTFTAQSTQEVKTGINPHLSWNSAPQPSGSQSSGFTHEITKLIGNALSDLTYSNTGTRSVDEDTRSLNPLVFTAVSSLIIYLMFGTGIQSCILVIILMLVVLIRSIK